MLKWILLLTALTIPTLSYGAVYQCKVNGQTVFSDQPCGDDAREIEVNAPQSNGGGSMVTQGSRDFLKAREQTNEISRIDREIDRLKDKKKAAQRNMERAARQYQSDKSRANNNIAGAVWEGSLAEDAQFQRQRFQSEIDSANRQIDRLYEERKRIMDQG